jgi:hypothetical protein
MKCALFLEALRSDAGEAMVCSDNIFIEKILLGATYAPFPPRR